MLEGRYQNLLERNICSMLSAMPSTMSEQVAEGILPCAPADMKAILDAHAYRYYEGGHHEVVVQSNMMNLRYAAV